MRDPYDQGSLRRSDLDADPFAQFDAWMDVHVGAREAYPGEPNAMALATVDPDGRPAARMVLLKGVSEAGFTWFTRYSSRKGVALASDGRAALLFYWPEAQRQVRVEGAVAMLSEAESDAYFASRPHGSRLAAVASPQSTIVPDREALEVRVARLSCAHPDGGPIPRPPDWGGYRLAPNHFEFWQGRRNRLHDRFRYVLELHDGDPAARQWTIERLAP